MVFCGQLSGLKAMKHAQLHRIWSISAKSYSKDVSIHCLRSLKTIIHVLHINCVHLDCNRVSFVYLQFCAKLRKTIKYQKETNTVTLHPYKVNSVCKRVGYHIYGCDSISICFARYVCVFPMTSKKHIYNTKNDTPCAMR